MDIVMPKMGESVSEGTILKWHKNKGDRVNRDEIIFEISTDKVDTEIPSPVDGVLSEIRFKEGDTVEVGTVVAIVETSGEKTQIQGGESTLKKTEPEIKKEPVSVITEKADTEAPVIPQSAELKTPDKFIETAGDIYEIRMPKMGESVMEGTIIKWHKKVGDSVKKDEIIYEISTDKVDTEVPSPVEGKIAEILVAEQETVEIGTVVAKIASGVSTISAGREEGSKLKEEKIKITASADEHTVKESPAKISLSAEHELEIKDTSKFLSPLVMNIAKKENITYDELSNIIGTGLDGRITKNDILSYVKERNSKPEKEINTEQEKETATAKGFTSVPYDVSYSDNEVEKIPMDNIRQKIMQHMVNSRDTSVHVSAMLEVDMTRIYNYIRDKRDEYIKKEGIKLTYMPFIAYSAVRALREFPLVNSAIEGNTIIRKKFINLGIAVAVEPTGLIVPNIKNADEKNIVGLAKSISDLAGRARNKKLTPDDITNGTFTITNYGVFGTIFGTPIINQPEVAILGVGTVVKKPVVIEIEGIDTIAVKPIMALTISHDHRLIDGMLGGKFLKYLKDNLESFDGSKF